MTLQELLADARPVVTVLSLLTFIGIVLWSYSGRRTAAFNEAANLPFADEEQDEVEARQAAQAHAVSKEKRNG